MDTAQLLFTAAAVMVVGWLAFTLGKRSRGPGAAFARADAVALVLEHPAGQALLIPVARVTENIYATSDGSSMVIVPSRVTAKVLQPYGKPFYIAFGGPAAMAIDPTALASIGIASLGIDKVDWGRTGEDAVRRLSEQLLRLAAPYTGRVHINPELRLYIAFDVPRVLEHILLTRAEISAATVKATFDAIQYNERLERMFLERLRARSAAMETIFRWLIIGILVAAIVILLLFRR